MILSQLIKGLEKLNALKLQLPDGTVIPQHFHLTEMGLTTKHYIDCGSKERLEKTINFQLWEASDYDHRLLPDTLLKIIETTANKLHLPDVQVQVEYEHSTISTYDLNIENGMLVLQNKHTHCQAPELCGIPEEKPRVRISKESTACAPGSGCC